MKTVENVENSFLTLKINSLICGENCGLLFKKGEIVKKVAEEEIVNELLKLINTP